jgi:mgtE-like transporter
MEKQDSKGKVIREVFPSEIVSIIGDLLGGTILSILILNFTSFPILILIIPALLSMRGNVSGPFIARTSRDIIIGEFNFRSWLENALATLSLSLTTSSIIGIAAILLNTFFIRLELKLITLFFLPIISILMTLLITVPCSTLLNIFAFKYGLDPNNVVGPIMTAIGDFSTVLSFYITIIILGVP